MKRKFRQTAICSILICICLILSAIPALAADTTYVLSFRPGANGSFSSGAESYLSGFGTVQKTAAGNLFVEVVGGTPFPADIVTYLQAKDGYYYKGGLSSSAAEHDTDCVAQYGILSGSGVPYTVQYVDAETGAELAESFLAYANAGDTINFSAKTISGYTADSATKSVTVSSGAVLQFLYKSDGSKDQTNYVYGTDTIINQTVSTSSPSTSTQTTPPSEEEIPETQAPTDDGEGLVPSEPEEIPEISPPLSASTDDGDLNAGLVAGIIGGVVLLLILVLLIVRKKLFRK